MRAEMHAAVKAVVSTKIPRGKPRAGSIPAPGIPSTSDDVQGRPLDLRKPGKERGISLGVYPAVSLKDARERRDEAKKGRRSSREHGAGRPMVLVRLLRGMLL